MYSRPAWFYPLRFSHCSLLSHEAARCPTGRRNVLHHSSSLLNAKSFKLHWLSDSPINNFQFYQNSSRIKQFSQARMFSATNKPNSTNIRE